MVSGLVMGLVPASASAVNEDGFWSGGAFPQEYESTPVELSTVSCVFIVDAGRAGQPVAIGDNWTLRCVHGDGVVITPVWFPGYNHPTWSATMWGSHDFPSFSLESSVNQNVIYNDTGVQTLPLPGCSVCTEIKGTVFSIGTSASPTFIWPDVGLNDGNSCCQGDFRGSSSSGGINKMLGVAGNVALSESGFAVPPRNGTTADGVLWAGAAVDECSGLTVEIEGDTEPFVSGDSMVVNVVNPRANPVASLEIKLSTDRPWYGVFAGQIGENGTYTIPVTPGSSVETALVRFKCVRSNGSIGYISYGTGIVSDDDVYLRGCKAITVSWPTAASVENVTHESTFNVVVDYQGPWGDVLEDVVLQSRFLVDSGDDGPGDGAYYWVTQDIGTVVSGTRSTLTVVVPSSANLPQAVNLEKRFFLGCNEASESNLPLIGWGTLAPGFSSTDGQYFDVPVEASCFSDLDVGYNPKTWVPGLVRTWSCTMKALFVPDSDSVTAELNSFKDKLRSNAPYSWGIASYSALLGFFTGSLEGLENAQACTQYFAETTMEPTTFVSAQPIELPALSFCVPEQFLTGHWVQFRTFAGLAVWVSLALTCVRILTHTPAPGDPEQLTLF
jgi:hypothetical protein